MPICLQIIFEIKTRLHQFREIKSIRILCWWPSYVVNYDCFANSCLFGKLFEPKALKVNANLQKNKQDFELGTLTVQNFDKAYMRTRSGRIVKSTQNIYFEYSFMLFSLNPSWPYITLFFGTYFFALTFRCPLNTIYLFRFLLFNFISLSALLEFTCRVVLIVFLYGFW